MNDFIGAVEDMILKDYSTLVRYSRYIEMHNLQGKPRTDAIRTALSEIFYNIARAIETDALDEVFMTVFPLRLTLESEYDKWDFRLVATLENKFGIMERVAEAEGN